MKIRNHLKSSLCVLCTFSIISFLMIFLISCTLIESLNDKIKLFTPLTESNHTTWAHIPGSLNYTYTKELYLFSVTDA